MEASFHRLFPLKACRHTHLRAEHFKQWLREAYPGENSNTPPRIERRMILVDIVQNMWKTGEIPHELRWTFLVLLPKGTIDTRGIGLLENLWNVVEELIGTRIRSSMKFHDVLHGFRDGRGTGTAIMELKLAQELSSVDHNPLFLVFLEIWKA